MADNNQKSVERLTDEEKLTAISQLISSLSELSAASRRATQELNREVGERAKLDDAGGVTGFLARRIKNGQVREAHVQSGVSHKAQLDALARIVELAGSRILNFRQVGGESAAEARQRLGGMYAQYKYAYAQAERTGALAGRNLLNGKTDVSSYMAQFMPGTMNEISSRTKEENLAFSKDTFSKLMSFRRLEGESDAEAKDRFTGLFDQYAASVSRAASEGAISTKERDKQYGRANERAQAFYANPQDKKFQAGDTADERARSLVSASLRGRFQRLVYDSGDFFHRMKPHVRRMKPFFGEGGFTPMVGLRSLGPYGIGAASAIGLFKQYLGFNQRVLGDVNARENQALLSGLDVGSLNALGAALGAYGGDSSGVARLSGGIATTLGGMRFGRGGGNLVEAARKYGLNLMGSGRGGLATTEEILYRMADLMKNADAHDREGLAYMAQSLGLSADQVRLMQGGSEKMKEQMESLKYITTLLNPEDVRARAEEFGRTKAEADAAVDVAKQRATSEIGTWWNRQLGNIANGYTTNGVVGAAGAATGTLLNGALNIISSPFKWAAEKFGVDTDASGYMLDLLRNDSEENMKPGKGFWRTMLGSVEGIIGAAASFASDDTNFTDSLKADYERKVPDKPPDIIPNGGESEFLKLLNNMPLDQSVKVGSVTINTNSSTIEGIGEDVGRGLANGRRGMANSSVGPGSER